MRFWDKIREISAEHIVIIVAFVIIMVSAIGGAVIYGASKANTKDIQDTQTALAEGIETEQTEAEEVVDGVRVSIETVSIEKDLKIKVVDEKGAIVEGVAFTFAVAQISESDEDAEESSVDTKARPVEEEIDIEEYEYEVYVDDDKDGIVHILDLKAGEFLVQASEVKGYQFEADTVKSWVKGKLEYKKVDVENEVKKESQVNSAVEDTAQNNVKVESAMVDTLPLIVSTVKANEIAREQVDTRIFPKVSIGKSKSEVVTAEFSRNCKAHIEVESEENFVEADCLTPGSYEKVITCSRCNAELSRETVELPAKGHTGGMPVRENEKAAQVGVPGSYESVIYCVVCEMEISRETVEIPPLEDANDATDVQEEMPDITAQKHMGNVVVFTAGDVQTKNGAYKETVSATIALPSDIRLYLWNQENSQAELRLEISDLHGIVDKDNITYASDNDAIVSCKKDATIPTKAKVSAKSAGTAQIEIVVPVWMDETKTVKDTKKITCTVSVDDYTGEAGAQIKDRDGNLLYTDEVCTKPATVADYTNSNVKLYGQPKYTGWQTLNGNLYYYKEDNTPATGSQVIGGVQYVFNEDGVLQTGKESLGIDVSKWQGNIDWKAVANSGVKFAIIRCAYRGASTGVIVEDPYFRQNIKGATANGIKVGVYFFTQAINEYEAVEEASTALGLVAGYNLAYPIFIDTEAASNGRANGLDVSTRTNVVKAFCETVRNAGYKPGIYASKSWYNTKLNMSQLNAYHIWVAQYSTTCTYTGRYDMWQYTSTGSIPGIVGNVDLNIGYTNY